MSAALTEAPMLGEKPAVMLDAALVYARHGDAVFPVWHAEGGRCGCRAYDCLSPGKHPIGSCAPSGVKNATTDEATIRQWWTTFPQANIGMPTGAVLDVDPKNGGFESLAQLAAQHGPLPVTAAVLTGGGGRHYHFAPVPGLRNSAGKVGPGLDIRGEGGYVLLPPSNHVSGGAYRDDLLQPMYDTPRAPMPAWLVALASSPAAESQGNGHRRAPDEWAAKLIGVPEGQRRAVALEIAGHYLGLRIAPAEVESILLGYAALCAPPFPEREARELVCDLARRDRTKDRAGKATAAASGVANGDGPAVSDYIEPIAVFLAEEDPPVSVVFPDLLPCGVIMLVHGEPRARKSLAAFELALSAAAGTAPFGLERFRPPAPIGVLYIQEEDPRSLTRPRLRRLVRERCGNRPPTTLHVAVRRGIDLDDPFWVTRIVEDLKRLGVRLLVLDAARRLSTKTDEGPAKVRELLAVLRLIVTEAGVTIVVVHHDIKPPPTGQDQRRRGQRASGGDWFAGCECPVHIERVSESETLVYPQDYKFSADPAPFTFGCLLDGRLIKRLVGTDTTGEHAETAGVRGKLLAWLRTNGPASKTAMKQAGFGWETIGAALDGLLRDGAVDAMPGRKAGSHLYFATGSEPSSDSQDGSPRGRNNAI